MLDTRRGQSDKSGRKMTTGVIAAFAEFERDLLIERTQSGLTRTKSKGKTLGNPRGLDVQTTN